MKGFFNLVSRQEFLERLKAFSPLEAETVPLDQARGRILARDLKSPEDLPPFARSTMDGFAVRARDTFGCSESEPAMLTITGEIAMGSGVEGMGIGPMETMKIWTGGALPAGADAVVMVEYTHLVDQETIEVFRPVAPGENVIAQGEDFGQGERMLAAGHRLRSQDLGVLAGVGITSVQVYRRPRVMIISTGDELVSPEKTPGPGQIRDINTTTLMALCQDSGADSTTLGIVEDDPEAMLDACEKALDQGADIVLISGGSSVGRRDFTLTVFESLEGTELLAHGVSIRPGKPTLLAKNGNRALFGLPGHVASAIVVFNLLTRPLIRRMSGLDVTHGLQAVTAVCAEEVPSVPGREDFVRVRLEQGSTGSEGGCGALARPVWGKSGLLRPLVMADGLMVVPRDSEGLEAGEEATVLLFP